MLRRIVVPAEFVGQSRVGITTHVNRHGVGQFFHIPAHLVSSQRTIDAHAQQIEMADRGPESFERLSRECASAGIGDRHGCHNGHLTHSLVEQPLDCEQAGFDVECVESGLHHEQVRTTRDQRAGLNPIGRRQIVEGHQTIRRVVDVRR